jgi:hypothetical protein
LSLARRETCGHPAAGYRVTSDLERPLSVDLSKTLDPALRRTITALIDDGYEIWERFDAEVRQKEWHPFVPFDYENALRMLLEIGPGPQKFLEWGSGTGVITIMADLLGFDAHGIELDGRLVKSGQELAQKYGSKARLVEGSFLPAGYRWRGNGDDRMGTIGEGRSGYLELGMPLESFDVVFGYPWDGEAPLMRDVMKQYGRADARLILGGPSSPPERHI